MYIIFIVIRTVIIHNQDQLFHIQASRCHGGCNLWDNRENSWTWAIVSAQSPLISTWGDFKVSKQRSNINLISNIICGGLTIKLQTPFLKSAIVLSRSNWSMPDKIANTNLLQSKKYKCQKSSRMQFENKLKRSFSGCVSEEKGKREGRIGNKISF